LIRRFLQLLIIQKSSSVGPDIIKHFAVQSRIDSNGRNDTRIEQETGDFSKTFFDQIYKEYARMIVSKECVRLQTWATCIKLWFAKRFYHFSFCKQTRSRIWLCSNAPMFHVQIVFKRNNCYFTAKMSIVFSWCDSLMSKWIKDSRSK